jgi:hypothetical protein
MEEEEAKEERESSSLWRENGDPKVRNMLGLDPMGKTKIP